MVAYHLGQDVEVFGVGVRHRRPREPYPGSLGDGLRLDVEVVEDLEVIGDEARRAHDHGRVAHRGSFEDRLLDWAAPTRDRTYVPRSATRSRNSRARAPGRRGRPSPGDRRDSGTSPTQSHVLHRSEPSSTTRVGKRMRGEEDHRPGTLCSRVRPARASDTACSQELHERRMGVVAADERERGSAAQIIHRCRGPGRRRSRPTSPTSAAPSRCRRSLDAVVAHPCHGVGDERRRVLHPEIRAVRRPVSLQPSDQSLPPEHLSCPAAGTRCRSPRTAPSAPRDAPVRAPARRGCPCSSARCPPAHSRCRRPSPTRPSARSRPGPLPSRAWTRSTSRWRCSTGVSGSTPWPRLNTCPSRSPARASTSRAFRSTASHGPSRDGGIKVPLDRPVVADRRPRDVEREAVVDAEGVAPRVPHQFQEMAGADPGMDRRHARAGDHLEHPRHMRQHEAAIVVPVQRPDPRVEDLHRARARLRLRAEVSDHDVGERPQELARRPPAPRTSAPSFGRRPGSGLPRSGSSPA